MDIPKGYERMFALVTEVPKRNSNPGLLEIGCGEHGHFVDYMRQQGWDTVGLDNREPLSQFVSRGDASKLRDVFGDKLFDLVLANQVLGYAPMTNDLIGVGRDEFAWIKAALLCHAGPDIKKDLDNMVKDLIKKILGSTFQQLSPDGLLIACGSDAIFEQNYFTQSEAEAVGYHVIDFKPSEAVLQKPR